MDGDLQRTQRQSQMKEQTVRDREHTSGGVFIAIDSNLRAVVGGKEGAVASIPGNEGRITQAWVNVRGCIRVFSENFWHSEGWSSRNEALLEAVLKRALITKHPWLVACDANMSPVIFEKCLWFLKNPDTWRRLLRAGQEVHKENGLRRFMTRSLRVTAQKGKSRRWRW